MDNKSKIPLNKGALPFYEPPPRKTSADIINEARLAIRESQLADNSYASTSIKPLQTQRPFTPRNKERSLFGKRTKNDRPPSSFSLRYLQNDVELYIPPTTPENVVITGTYGGVKVRDKVLFHKKRSNSVSEISDGPIFNLGVKEVSVQKIRLPSLESMKNVKKKLFKNTYSLDNLPEENEQAIRMSERNAFSSPQERTDYSDAMRTETPFGRSSKKQTLSQCLLLGPQNLNKIFGNKQIIENSDTLFVKSGYVHKSRDTAKEDKQIDAEIGKEQTVENILKLLYKDELKNKNSDHISNLISDLYDCMEKENMLSIKISSKLKIQILKCLYKFVDSDNMKLLLNTARVILALKVTGSNLSGVCKLIFKVAKNDKNDELFFTKNTLELFVDSLGRSSPIDDAEACVYGYGAIKFLTMNVKLLQKILDLGILHLMVLHIKIINNAKMEMGAVPEQTNNVLFQLTGALRNLASDEDMYENFVVSQAISQLCHTMDLFSSDIDIISNISRTLSTISTNEGCSDAISEYKTIYKVIIRLFEKYPGNEEIIVRLAYTLGNIMANLDNARIKFYNEKSSITSLVNLWKLYLERTLTNYSLKSDSVECSTSSEDVLVKIIRIVANMAINPDIGKKMNHHYGIKLIDEFLKVLISNPFKKNDELMLSILSTLNNLSFYYTAEFDEDIFHVKQIDIMEGIAEYTSCENQESVIESMRIMGNLSRSKLTRDYIVDSRIFNSLIETLKKDDINLLRTAIGVFVNLMADKENRLLLQNNKGISILINVMNNYGQYDWSLSMLICQVIWNFCIDSVNLYEIICNSEMQQLMTTLIDYLDEEKLFGITDTIENVEIYMTQEYIVWEEFANVATNLLEKIEQFLDNIDTINQKNFRSGNTKDSGTNISFTAW